MIDFLIIIGAATIFAFIIFVLAGLCYLAGIGLERIDSRIRRWYDK